MRNEQPTTETTQRFSEFVPTTTKTNLSPTDAESVELLEDSMSPIAFSGSSMQRAPHSLIPSPDTIYKASTSKLRDPTSPSLGHLLQQELSSTHSHTHRRSIYGTAILDGRNDLTPHQLFPAQQTLVPSYDDSESDNSQQADDLEIFYGRGNAIRMTGSNQSCQLSDILNYSSKTKQEFPTEERALIHSEFNCDHRRSPIAQTSVKSSSANLSSSMMSKVTWQQSMKGSNMSGSGKMKAAGNLLTKLESAPACNDTRMTSRLVSTLDQSMIMIANSKDDGESKIQLSKAQSIPAATYLVESMSCKAECENQAHNESPLTSKCDGTKPEGEGQQSIIEGMGLLDDLLNASQPRSCAVQTPKSVCFSTVKVERKDA